MLSVYGDVDDIAKPVRQLIIDLFTHGRNWVGEATEQNETDAVKRRVIHVLIKAEMQEMIDKAIEIFKNRQSVDMSRIFEA